MTTNYTQTYLTQQEAAAIDEALMGPSLGFSVDQLMELAGLSVASSLAAEYPPDRFNSVLVLAGPGNNGGDGLVAARHLTHFGYKVHVCYPKPTDKPLYNGLVKQCQTLGLPLLDWSQLQAKPLREQYSVVVDALFGFSFKGQPRAPFDDILKALRPDSHPPVIVSVDIPSGWHVEEGDTSGQGMRPDMLVSLTAPKLAARHFTGAHHYLGGRFVPPAIKEQYRLQLPRYPGAAQCVRIGGSATASLSAAAAQAAAVATAAAGAMLQAKKVADMRISYELGGLHEADFAGRDPMVVFDEWFKAALEAKACEEVNAISLATCDAAGRPSVRVVLLKGYDERGFVLYTNYKSRKGQELDRPGAQASFCIYWDKLQRQIRVEGSVERVPEAESDEYFQSRPRGSRIGAWVSQQSQVAAGGRPELEQRNAELSAQYVDESQPVPRPPHWGGYLIRPQVVELWQGRPSRLHDRIRYRREGGQWAMERLQP